MNYSYICQPCRRKLGLIRCRILPRGQQRSNFISLSRTKPATTKDGKEDKKDGILGLGDDVDRRQGSFANLPPRNRNPVRPRVGNTGPSDILESLFEQSITETISPKAIDPKSVISLEPYKKIEHLKDMMRQNYPVADSFRYFVEHFGPGAEHMSDKSKTSRPSYLTSTARNLMRLLITHKNTDPNRPGSSTLPSATEIASVFHELGLLNGPDWADLTKCLIKGIIDQTGSRLLGDIISDKKTLFRDLLGAWNVACRDGRNLRNLPIDATSILDWSNIPSVPPHGPSYVYRKSGEVAAFGVLTPWMHTNALHRMPSLALATYHLVTSDADLMQDMPGDAARFTALLTRVIGIPGLDLEKAALAEEDEAIISYIKEHSEVISNTARAKIEIEDNKYRTVGTPATGSTSGGSFVQKRLQNALKTKDRRQVDALWADVVHWPCTNEELRFRSRDGTLTMQLSNHFIMVFMALRQPNKAINVWNHMIRNNVNPNLGSWESMLSGCKSARDGQALEDVWKRMELARVQPDEHCWTTRISGLMHCYQPDAAMKALDQMGRKWLEIARIHHPKMPLEELKKKDDVPGAIKPNITVVNAAINGALQRKRQDHAQQILAWAGTYGINPDVSTYNTLLMPLLRAGETERALGLFRQMNESGIEADIYTYTIILDETFRFSNDLSPQEQRDLVFGIFDELESTGLKATQHTYGKIIYSLLQNSSGDMSVVNIVLQRMESLNLEPSVHIYTSLMQHYLQQSPPQVDAAHSLIQRATMVVGSTDHVFWGRAVEGFSRAGETAAALRIQADVSATGSFIGWLAMRELLRALARNNEWDQAKTLVRNAFVEHGGPLPPDVKGTEGQHWFWKDAQEMELLGHATASRPSEL